MNPSDLRALLERAHITQGAAAARCGVTLRTMQNWLAGATRIPQTAMNEMIIMEGEQNAAQFERETGTPGDACQVLEFIAAEQRRRIARLKHDLEEERAALVETMKLLKDNQGSPQ